jgi:hypothetical protein
MFTEGISAKLTWPLIALLGIGALVLITGAILDLEVVIYVGIGLLGAAGIQAPTAFAAPPSPVSYIASPEGNGADSLTPRVVEGNTAQGTLLSDERGLTEVGMIAVAALIIAVICLAILL